MRHVLHTAGVPAPPYDTTVEDLCNWDHMCVALAGAKPWWEPGTRFGYHAKTFGFLLGEIVRRATGRTLSWWLRETVTVPLGIRDEVHFGVPDELLDRVARQQPPIGPPPAEPEPGSPLDRAIPPGIRSDAEYANRRDVLTSDIPLEGTMTARGAVQGGCGSAGVCDSRRDRAVLVGEQDLTSPLAGLVEAILETGEPPLAAERAGSRRSDRDESSNAAPSQPHAAP